MAAHPAVLGVVEAVLGQQLLHSADGPAQPMRWRVHVHEVSTAASLCVWRRSLARKERLRRRYRRTTARRNR